MNKQVLVGYLRRLEPHAVECVLIACTLWASKCLMTNASVFHGQHDLYNLLKAMNDSERFWGRFCFVAALLISIGFVAARMRLNANFKDFGFFIRIVGLALSAFFWTVTGVSFVVSGPGVPADFPLLFLGAASFYCMFSSPILSGDA